MNAKHILIAGMFKVHVHLLTEPERHRALGGTTPPGTLLILIILDKQLSLAQVEDAPSFFPALWKEKETQNKPQDSNLVIIKTL